MNREKKKAGGRRQGWQCSAACAVALGAALWAGTPVSVLAQAEIKDTPSAVIVMYHRFGERDYPATNITIGQFEAHLRELASGGYTVLPVAEIINAVRGGRPLPAKTVGLTIDDAYLSVYREAWPRLKQAGLPFTLFVATRAVDRGLGGFMTWDQIREMAEGGATIGAHTASHLHMPRASMEQNREELETSNRRFREELGAAPGLFAYPYGEASLALEVMARQSGYAAAFGQHSGALGMGGNFFNLPRFALNERYGDLSRFRLVTGTLPLPVTDVTPADPLITGGNPPAMGFTIKSGDPELSQSLNRLACYISGSGRARVERLGDQRIEIRADAPFRTGRTRLNCTLPTRSGRWRWFGRQFYVPPG